jgi:UDP-glucose 4-epimerase
VLNVGTGEGVTVRELVSMFERVFGRPVKTVDAPPRPGDAVGAYANVDRARELLGWSSRLSVADGIEAALEWAQRREAVLGYP